MDSTPEAPRIKLIVDSVHGDIHLTPIENRVIDTASFQRLRHLKQLGMAQATYPNATHTRFAHSLGVLGIMEHITRVAQKALSLSDEQAEDIRLAGLLHDIGHYPYSHLMEKVDKVRLTEEFLGAGTTFHADKSPYPNHEVVGELIVTHQPDLREALGGDERAQRIAALFTRKTTANPQLSKLIHSSLDMDRLDYLLRDSRAAGVPYGRIDLNYLLNNFRASPSGMLGVEEKALTAVDHFLLARLFMHRSVYYHKTTFGLEEACRQLLRRLRDQEKFEILADGNAVAEFVKGASLGRFTDGYVDALVEKAAIDDDLVIRALANSIRRRQPPKLLREVQVLEQNGKTAHAGALFKKDCKHQLKALADKFGLPLGRFLVCETRPLTLEERGALLTEEQARSLEPEEKEEIIKVFIGNDPEPISVVNIPHSIVHLCSNHYFQAFRLYLVCDASTDTSLVKKLRQDVNAW
jgi:HD superfamily phosphohydrolase